MDELCALGVDSAGDSWMTVAESTDADAGKEVEVIVARLVAEVDAFAADEKERVALVGLQQKVRFG